MKNNRSRRTHFTRDLILVFIFLSVAVIVAITYFSAVATRDISEKYINTAADRAVDAFQAMTDVVERDLRLIIEWRAAGKFSLADMSALNGLLFPIIKRDAVLFGISVADTNGESYYVIDQGDGWRTSRTGTAASGRQTVRRFWDAEQNSVAEERYSAEYDPRQRPWFSPALAADDVFWTAPYPFYDRKDVGITASMGSGDAVDKKQLVVAFDILLEDLFQEIHRMGPSENSRVLILKRDAQLYVPGSEEAPPDFRSMDAVKSQVIKKMVASWTDDPMVAGEAFSVRHDSETWWCGFRAIEATSRNIWIGVMVPESDIIGNVKQRRAGLWTVGLCVVVLAGVLAFWLNRRHGRSDGDPAIRFDSRRPDESVFQLIAMGEGRSIEFKSTMRMNLHTQKAGKEIEIAWLKALAAFMNTDGGTLLIGVSDDGQINGLESDGFANEDKCRLHFKNLINQHIGAEFSKYLRFALVDLEDNQIAVVDCRRSPGPVYLKNGKNEAFYIRNGPSSDQLPVSKVVAYVRDRE